MNDDVLDRRIAESLARIAHSITFDTPEPENLGMIRVPVRSGPSRRRVAAVLSAAAVVVAMIVAIGWVRTNDPLAPTAPTATVAGQRRTVELGAGPIVWPSDASPIERSTPADVALRFATDVLQLDTPTIASFTVDGTSASLELVGVANPDRPVSVELTQFPIGWAITGVGEGLAVGNDTIGSVLTFPVPPEAVRAEMTWRTLDELENRPLTVGELSTGSVAIGDILTVAAIAFYDEDDTLVSAVAGTFNNTIPTTPTTVEGATT